MRLTTIFHFLNFKQNLSCGIIDNKSRYNYSKQIYNSIFGKDLNIYQIKKFLVNLIKYQMSFEFTFTKLFLLYTVFFIN